MKTLFAVASAITLISTPAKADAISDSIARDLPGLMEVYRDFHANPELSFQEVRSAARLAAEARKAGFEVTEKVGKTGVVAVMRNGPGPVVLIRADMDGLPVIEQTGLAYASKARGTSTAGVESGIMHACGHDTHMTAWIEVARLMAANRQMWSGTLVMVGQPAEEVGLGARAMLADGLYTRFPKPNYAIAFHDSGDLAGGVIGTVPGYSFANVDSVDLTVRGLGGHGAYPQTTKDPIVLASAIVTRLQTLVSREMSPFEPSVVTVGSFHAGAKHNIIPDEAQLQLTVRSYGDAHRQRLLDGIARIAKGEGIAAGLPEDRMPTVLVRETHTRATWNTPDFTRKINAVLTQSLGADRVVETTPTMAGEDFGEYGLADSANIQATILWVGARRADDLAKARKDGTVLPSLHSPFFVPEADKVIAAGAQALVISAMALMPKG
ncbi:MAG: peptidase M20 [Novosphingobium sp. 32-60-15]|uniref:amidohydrolase n=1 Tax=unclassified Novosphingobium TaxID=2644732 RepID=UPI000BD4647B|nr:MULTISPECIES: amidohydrolase [unclassified Novosphingobium]OYX63657.1 MAG: peptidase M20 [Novosphingobium sp. 32-60-15]